MFEVGDQIFYPMHGPGVIEGEEEIEFQGELRKYYVIKIAANSMRVRMPIDNMTNSHIRRLADLHSIDLVLDLFHDGKTAQILPWKQRFKINTEKVKSGNLKDCAEVVRDLNLIQNGKSLNNSEKQMLDKAKRLLVGEIKLVKGITKIQVDELLRIIN